MIQQRPGSEAAGDYQDVRRHHLVEGPVRDDRERVRLVAVRPVFSPTKIDSTSGTELKTSCGPVMSRAVKRS